jgi:hypothetical protein
MATAGHFVTMTGVFFFYFMFLDSKIEKKTTAYLHSLVARFNKRANYYTGKLVHLNMTNKANGFLPVAKAQRLAYTLY